MSRKKGENYYTLDHANKFADRERVNPNRIKKRQSGEPIERAVDAVTEHDRESGEDQK